MAAITFDAKSAELTSADSTDNTYLTEAEKSGRRRIASGSYTAAVSIANGSQIELCRIRGARATGGVISSSGRTSLRAEVGFTLTSNPVDDDDNKLLGGAGTPISIASAGVVALDPHDGTQSQPYVDLPSGGDVSVFLTTDNNGGAGLQAGDVIKYAIEYIQ